MGQCAQPHPGSGLSWIQPPHTDPAGIGAQRPGQDPEGGRLARAIGTEQAPDTGRPDRERQPAQRMHGAEPSMQRIDLDHGAESSFVSVRTALGGHTRIDFGTTMSKVPAGPGVDQALAMLNEIGDGIAIVDVHGEIHWMSQRVSQLDAATLRALADLARTLIPDMAAESRRTWRRRFSSGEHSWEVVASSLGADRMVVVFVDATVRQRLASRMDQIDAAGGELLDLDAHIVNPLNVAERLQLIERKIGAAMESVFGFAHFEVRLRHRKTNQLELVMGHGLDPLRIGESIHAEPVGHGISGLVASTGRSYICNDPARDPNYLPGLPLARSSLTVPLLLHERVIGVINVESVRELAFGDEDQVGLETYGRYVAMALNILDMLIVERSMTSERVGGLVRDEIAIPVQLVREAATAVAAGKLDAHERLEAALETLEARIRSATGGPQTVLGIDKLEHRSEPDPVIAGKRILVADDEPGVRDAIKSILGEAGASVDVRADGASTLDAVAHAISDHRPYDLVVSDVRMPDRNGYEVFRGTRDMSPETPVLLMTGFGYDPNHSIVRSSQEGLQCCLFKPFQATQLIEEVRKALLKQA